MSSFQGGGISSAIPAELEFPTPVTVPEGLRQIQIRIPAKSTLPSGSGGASVGTEIIVEVPEISNAFLDPTTTFISARVRLVGDFTANNATAAANTYLTTTDGQTTATGITDFINNRPLFGTADPSRTFPVTIKGVADPPTLWQKASYPSSVNPGYILGSGWNFFNQYLVMFNGNVPGERILNPGILDQHLNAYTGGISWQYGNWHTGDLTIRLEDKGTNIGAVLLDLNREWGMGVDPTPTNIFGTSNGKTVGLRGVNYGDQTWTAGPNINTAGTVDNGYIPGTDFIRPGANGAARLGAVIDYNSYTGVYYRRYTLAAAANAPNALIIQDQSGKKTTSDGRGVGADGYGTWCGAVKQTTWSYNMDLAIPLFGVMGSGNDKLVPMFNGPIRLQFYTNDLNNIFTQGATNMKATALQFLSFEFVATYYEMSPSLLNQVRSALPVPNIITSRITSFEYGNIATQQGISGMFEYPLPTRKASTKLWLITWQPLASSNLGPVGGMNIPIEKNLASVCPNLTSPTQIVINNEFYPRQGLDCLNRPMDVFMQNLIALNMAYDAITRPAFNYTAWLKMACDLGNRISQTNYAYPAISTTAATGTGVNAGGGFSAWDFGSIDLATAPNVTDVAGDTEANSTVSLWTPYLSYYAGTQMLGINLGGGLIGSDVSVLDTVDDVGNVNSKPIRIPSAGTTAAIGGATYAVNLNLQNGKSISTDTSYANYRSKYFLANPIRKNLVNQWDLLINTEAFSRRNFLCGTSTLTGAIFLRATHSPQTWGPVNNQSTGLPCPGVFHFFCMYDALVAFVLDQKSVLWRF